MSRQFEFNFGAASTRRSFLSGAVSLAAGALLTGSAYADPPQPEIKPLSAASKVKFKKHVINEASDFEAACSASLSGNGRVDIVSGDTWYEAPNWTPHKFREIGVWGRSATESGYRASFADIPVDVNGDGKLDVVSSDYASGEIFWHENVGNTSDLWPKHLIAKPGSAETTVLAPILGRSKFCILPNVAGIVVWYELRTAAAKPEWVEHIVGKEGAGHGIGWGDVNGDGKIDIICPNGWYEQVDALNDKWIWHPEFRSILGACSIGMPVLDVDGDGKNDIIIGAGHNYGISWLQQTPSGATKWTERVIDNTWSQPHAVQLADLEHNRHPVILTGKRYKAHDHDPGALEPLVICYYKYDRASTKWTKYIIDEGTHAGTGLQMWTGNIVSKNRVDILAPGKSGLYLFENLG